MSADIDTGGPASERMLLDEFANNALHVVELLDDKHRTAAMVAADAYAIAIQCVLEKRRLESAGTLELPTDDEAAAAELEGAEQKSSAERPRSEWLVDRCHAVLDEIDHEEPGNYRGLDSRVRGLVSALSAARAEAERLREMLRHLLVSADASWEERGEGHGWREACQDARGILGWAGPIYPDRAALAAQPEETKP